MVENTRADRYMSYLDKILAGEKDIDSIEDEEIKKLILLAKTMIDNDLSNCCKLKDKLREWLMEHFNKKLNISFFHENNDELDEKDLDLVAAGFTGQSPKDDICFFCGSRSAKLHGKCPVCGH